MKKIEQYCSEYQNSLLGFIVVGLFCFVIIFAFKGSFVDSKTYSTTNTNNYVTERVVEEVKVIENVSIYDYQKSIHMFEMETIEKILSISNESKKLSLQKEQFELKKMVVLSGIILTSFIITPMIAKTISGIISKPEID